MLHNRNFKMRYIYACLLLLFPFLGLAQFTTVTHTTGSATYGAYTVNVTGAGSASTFASYCGAGPYWIGAMAYTGVPGSYTYRFSSPVSGFRVSITAADPGESITIAVNGVHYSLTAANVFTFAGTCGAPAMTLSGDSLLTTASTTSNGGIKVFECGITSVTVATNGYSNGSVYTFEFTDSVVCSRAANNGPVCPGDTLRLSGVGTTSDTYAWSGPGGFTSTLQNPFRANVSIADTGVYRLIFNRTDTSYTRFVLKPKPEITATSNAPLCDGQFLTLDAAPDSLGTTYSWVGPNSFSAVVRNPTRGPIALADSGLYTVYANRNGCKDTSVVWVAVKHVPVPSATNNSPVCQGSDVNLFATDTLSGVNFAWSGPAGFTSTRQNPIIYGAAPTASGIYSVTASMGGCTTAPATTLVVVNAVPVITAVIPVNPSPCVTNDGTITLQGLVAGTTYALTYFYNGSPVATSATADGAGNIVLTGLYAGAYDRFVAAYLGCSSSASAEVKLKAVGFPPVPVATSNGPVCEGSTLALFATDSLPGATYSWAGPSGFTSSLQNPTIFPVTTSVAGTYTVTAYNGPCGIDGTVTVVVYPAVSLVGVTADQTINFGSSVQLEAFGAQYYTWLPDDGALSNPFINNPVATPKHTTTFTVRGMNSFGCSDSAMVTITVNFPDTLMIPTGFTPNGDGVNDVFRVGNIREHKLVEFSIFNRWGEMVYHNVAQPNEGWDGNHNGAPQDLGNYKYIIILASPKGENRVYKGDVTLIR
jgi:gliding motility-associated-like protein